MGSIASVELAVNTGFIEVSHPLICVLPLAAKATDIKLTADRIRCRRPGDEDSGRRQYRLYRPGRVQDVVEGLSKG